MRAGVLLAVALLLALLPGTSTAARGHTVSLAGRGDFVAQTN